MGGPPGAEPGLAVLGRDSMLKGHAAPAGKAGAPSLARLVRDSPATFTGLRLRDGTVILKVARRGRVEQVRLIDWDAFDPERHTLELPVPLDAILGSPSRSPLPELRGNAAVTIGRERAP